MASIINAATSGGLVTTADTSGVLALQTAGTTAVTVDAAGGVKTLNTISVGNATPSTSGAGITFPASQSASSDANTLDDYEEGTFTCTASSFTNVTSFTVSYAVYTKIGRIVNVEMYGTMSITTANLLTGGLLSLPFSATNSARCGSFARGQLELATGHIEANNSTTAYFSFAVSDALQTGSCAWNCAYFYSV